MSKIDFKKVDSAFAYLANDHEGQAQLAEFAGALKRLTDALPKLNDHEAQYVSSALLSQRLGVQSNIVQGKGAKPVAGFLIKSAVEE